MFPRQKNPAIAARLLVSAVVNESLKTPGAWTAWCERVSYLPDRLMKWVLDEIRPFLSEQSYSYIVARIPPRQRPVPAQEAC